MYKIIFSILLLYFWENAYGVSGNLVEPYQVGITVKDGQPCFYLHGNVAIHGVSIYSNYVKGIQENQGYNYLGGYLSQKNQTNGHDIQHCIKVSEVNFSLDIPYNASIWEKERPSSFFTHSENFCLKQKDKQLYISETAISPNGKDLVCTEKPLIIKYQPKPMPQVESSFWEKFWNWFTGK